MPSFANALNHNLILAAAIATIDSEAKQRGHRVLIQELSHSASGWYVCLWARGHEDYDSFYERLFASFIK